MLPSDFCTVTHLYKHPGVIIGNSTAIFNLGTCIQSATEQDLFIIRNTLQQRIMDCPRVIVNLTGYDHYSRAKCLTIFSGLSTSTLKTIEQLQQIVEFRHDNNPTILQIVAKYLN